MKREISKSLSWRLPLRIFPTLCYAHYALPSSIFLCKFCKGHNDKDEQCVVIQIYLSIGYLPEGKL